MRGFALRLSYDPPDGRRRTPRRPVAPCAIVRNSASRRVGRGPAAASVKSRMPQHRRTRYRSSRMWLMTEATMKNVLLLVHDDAGQEARFQAALDVTRAL